MFSIKIVGIMGWTNKYGKREFPGKGDKFLETTNQSPPPYHFHTPFLTIHIVITSHKLSPCTLQLHHQHFINYADYARTQIV